MGIGAGPSNLTDSAGTAVVIDSDKAPNINTLASIFFIQISPRLIELNLVSVNRCVVSITIHWLYLGISESGTSFSQNGNSRGDGDLLLTIRVLLERNNRLTEGQYGKQALVIFTGRCCG